MFQQLSRDAPTSAPARLTPLNTAELSGPPIVIQYSAACCTTAPAGMPVRLIVPVAGAPARVASETPLEAIPPPWRMKPAPGFKPVSRSLVEAVRTRIRGLVTPLSGSVIG